MKKKVFFITQAAAIAALYTVLTLTAGAFGLANGAIQLRISEALTILPFFTPAAIPGLFIGCVVSNILTGCVIWDIIFGSLALPDASLYSFCRIWDTFGTVYSLYFRQNTKNRGAQIGQPRSTSL